MRKIRSIIAGIILYSYDAYLFLKYGNYGYKSKQRIINSYKIVIDAHRIEKGLSLLNRRHLFGLSVLDSLIQLKKKSKDLELHAIEMLNGAAAEYKEFNKKQLIEDIEWSEKLNYLITDQYSFLGGIRKVQMEIGNLKAVDFLSSRYSSRRYTSSKVDIKIINNIVSTALRAPSQCNRQSVSVTYISDYIKITKCLELQGGTRGFTKEIGNLFAVTSDLAGWQGMQQRNQLYVDGGLFSMMLLLSIQAHNLGCCPLNAALTPKTERKILNLLERSQSDRLIMLIAFGYQVSNNDNTVDIAYSHRDSLNNKLKIIA